MLIMSDTQRIRAGIASLDQRCAYCKKALHAYSLLLFIINQFVEKPLTLEDRIFDTNFTTKGIPQLNIMLGEWFGQLVQNVPKDLLTSAQYPKEYGPEQAKALESLGGFGNKMDPGLKGPQKRPIQNGFDEDNGNAFRDTTREPASAGSSVSPTLLAVQFL